MPVIFDLLEHEGLCLGGSSGINVAGAIRLAKEMGPGHTIVTILADFGTRYQSKLFNPDFLRSKKLPVPDLAGAQAGYHRSVREGVTQWRPSACSARIPICAIVKRRSSRSGPTAASCSTARVLRRVRRPASRPRHADDVGRKRSGRQRHLHRPGKSEIAHVPAAGARAGRSATRSRPRSTGTFATRACGCIPRCICCRPCCLIRSPAARSAKRKAGSTSTSRKRPRQGSDHREARGNDRHRCRGDRAAGSPMPSSKPIRASSRPCR